MWTASLFQGLLSAAAGAAVLLLSPGAVRADTAPVDAYQPPGKGAAGSLRTIGAYPDERGVGHTVTMLPDGRVFVYGHRPEPMALDTVAFDPRGRTGARSSLPPLMWDPQQKAWRQLDGPPQCPYSPYLHTATALPDGRILIAGGLCDAPHASGDSQAHLPYKAMSIWNDRTRKWEDAPALAQDRIYHSATLMADGSVLLAGGDSDTRAAGQPEPVLDAVELFSRGAVTPLPALRIARARHTATRLDKGLVLVAGGVGPQGKAIAEVEIWNPDAQAWKNGPPMKYPRHSHSASLLSDGRILVAGGIGQDGNAIGSVEIFDPRANAWQDGAPMLQPLQRQETVVLPNDDVLLLGVGYQRDHAFGQAMLWERATGDWRPAGHLFPDRLRWAQSYALAAMPGKQDKVLAFDSGVVMEWSRAARGGDAASAYGPRTGVTTAALKDGRVLVLGGSRWRPGGAGGTPMLDWSEIVEPKSGRFSLTGRMTQARESLSALTLDDGRVLVAGNAPGMRSPMDKLQPYHFAELWNPLSGRWTPLPELDVDGPENAVFENFGKLSDGRVMLIFSADKGFRALVWDPRTREVQTQAVDAPHRVGAAVGITPGGRVLFASGMFFEGHNGPDTTELWDSRTGRTVVLPAPAGLVVRGVAEALVLRDGNVLLMDRTAYSSDKPGAVAVLDVQGAHWRSLPPVPAAPHTAHSLAELPDGTIATDAYLLRPGAGAWTPIASLPQDDAAIVELQSGRRAALSPLRPQVALLDEASGKWQNQAGYYLRRKPEQRPVLVELSDGRVMVAGNVDQPGWPKETTIQLWDPKADTWTTAGQLARVYPGRSEAALLPSGQVLYVGLTLGDALKCETGHPADKAWTDCSATLPTKSGRLDFTLARLGDGRIALLLGQTEAYAYNEQDQQWRQVAKVAELVRDNPGILDNKWRLPDDCAVSGALPLRLFGAHGGREIDTPIPVTGIRPDSARVIALADGTVVAVGYPEGADEIGSGFFHRKAGCAGFGARPGDEAFMPAASRAAPEAPASTAPSGSALQRLRQALAPYKWLLLALPVAFLLYVAIRRGVTGRR